MKTSSGDIASVDEVDRLASKVQDLLKRLEKLESGMEENISKWLEEMKNKKPEELMDLQADTPPMEAIKEEASPTPPLVKEESIPEIIPEVIVPEVV